ncbi:hypothetical protein DYB28_009655 [Aphanomyces astaci]|uniref:Uncharacterized protein n=1 Tax=Aphanomyces astaci TaxID=112090 RepID=A0A397AT40_APHAT|nr:hypothetical protein DYB36_000461 [Aphanomyces astaci]RHY41316.1 hypothetical protein DYB34_000067 [Aphanomyces astaci]RLO00707.1 hypothetical protein DYB28_009655 [Aphanomyces astaci]
MNSRDSVGSYLTSLRNERKIVDKIDEGVPFFVPQLSKVKTSAMCTKTQTHLLFGYERLVNQGESYRKQGNAALYTDEKMLERHNLQNDRQVQAALGRFWDTFGSIRNGKSSIEELEYCDVFVKFFKALVPPQEVRPPPSVPSMTRLQKVVRTDQMIQFSVPEARIIVEKDWARDVGENCEVMAKSTFYKSLFEVADLWTVSIGVDEYTKFLTKLFERVTMTVFDQEKALWLTKFAELDMIKSSWNDENQDNKSPSPKRAVGPTTAVAKLKKKSHTIAAFKLTPTPEGGVLDPSKANDAPNLPDLASPDRPPRRPLRPRPTPKPADDITATNDELKLLNSGAEGPTSPVASPVKTLSPKKSKQLTDTTTNQDRVAMPSIYLSPDLDVPREDDIAVKRRQRENTKLVQRLRR